jgi:RNA polymerase sigma-70 factor (ECF subfamily)
MPDALSDTALAGIYRDNATVAPPGASDAALGAAIRALFDEGQRAWPGVALGIEAFVAHVAARAGEGLPPEGRGPDLYLACGCALGVRGAVEAFDRAYLTGLGRQLGQLGARPAFVDEVRQELRDKLFVGTGGSPPKIGEYAGDGPLGSWIRVVAVRAALNLRRRPAAEGGGGHAGEPAARGDPEVEYREEHYRRAFDEALRGAVAALAPDHLHLLRRHLAQGVVLEALAAELGVNRATVVRRLAAARTALRWETRRRLQAALGAGDSELESLARMLRSHIGVSLPTLLRSG